MRSVPAHIRSDRLAEVIDREWGLQGRLDYRPVGAGAYHWVLEEASGARHFVTCDDLDTKPWLGSDRDTALAGLSAVYRLVADMATTGRVPVAGPRESQAGELLVRLDIRTTVAIFAFVAGEAGRWGESLDEGRRRDVVDLLARLHAEPRAFVPSTDPLDIPGREVLEDALDAVGSSWDHGPLADRARRELAAGEARVRAWMGELDRVTAELRRAPAAGVLTHGEPHPENIVWTGDGPVLVDWDRVALSRPERDLWMLDDGTGAASRAYHELTGTVPDPAAIGAYRLLWALTDLAAFTAELRRPHTANADTAKALRGIRLVLGGSEPAPYG